MHYRNPHHHLLYLGQVNPGLPWLSSSLWDLSGALTTCHVWSRQGTNNELNQMDGSGGFTSRVMGMLRVVPAESEQSRLNGKSASQLTANNRK